jgi:uroporphyrinogen decarboxylase
MSKKGNTIAALNGSLPVTAVPIWELSFHLWDKAGSKRIILGREFEALTSPEQEKALQVNAEIMLSVAEDLHFSAITIPCGYWEVAPGHPAYYWLPEDAPIRQVQALNKMGTGDLMLVANTGGVMAIPSTNEYVSFSYKLFDAPEEIDERARQNLENGLESVKRFSDEGVQAMLTSSDLADNHGPFFNPEQMERFILPYMREWARAVRSQDCFAILHTDGNVNTLIKDLLESGIHAMQAIDPVAGMDINKVKETVGNKLCLCGNVDCGLLVTGTPETVFEAAKDLLLAMKEKGGYVFGASNAVQQEVPMENYRAMIEAWKEYGRMV